MANEKQSSSRHVACCSGRVADKQPVDVGLFRRFLRPWSRRRFVQSTLGTVLLGPIAARAAEDAGPCGPPPPPKPAQASGAEGIPPLPLPAQPLRRTEKKNPPKPPVIAVKIKTGSMADWATDLNDVNNLLVWMKANLGVNFTYEEKTLEQVDLEAGDVPVLYRTGHNAFSFTAGQRRRLRDYILRGGMIIFDACCGRRAFAESARREIAAILPDRKLKPVAMDHPIFHCYYENAGLVRFTPHSLQQNSQLVSPGPSRIEGVEIACRMAVVFSRHDLSCGWDMHTHTIPECTYIESEDALKLGANFMAYATATRDLSVSAAEAKAYADADDHTADKFRVGQLVHEGDWSPDPVGLRNLLDVTGTITSLKVSFATEPVRANFKELTKHPFVYMTGHDDFTWDAGEVAAIRRYLANGGFLFADACCGRRKFDLAFRREIAKVLDGGAMEKLPPDHPIYRIHHKIDEVKVTEAAHYRRQAADVRRPAMEGAAVNGRLAVVYSPLALNVGWRLHPVPYAVGYEPKSALELGVNTVMYALTM